MDFAFEKSFLSLKVLVTIAVLQLVNAKSFENSLNLTEPLLYNSADNSSTTFQICDKIPEKIHLHTKVPPTSHLASTLNEYQKNQCIRVIQGTDFSRNAGLFEPTENNGFISTVIQCYNKHHNLVIRPDDIWTAIISQFSFYINANAERFRKLFVNFDGKKDLNVHLGSGTLDSVSYIRFVELMERQIVENIVDPEIRNWIMPNFTTTTQDDKITAGVIFMATLKTYFNYRGTILCGIPKITLEGTVDDWRDIQQRLSKLKSYDLDNWVDKMLQPILDQFVRAKQGDVDEEFWNSIVKVKIVGCGSTDVSGWITAFNVFDKNGKWVANTPKGQRWPQMDIKSIVSGIVEVDVTIDYNGKIYKTVMFAGHMAKEVLPDGYTLQPKIGWAIALKNSL